VRPRLRLIEIKDRLVKSGTTPPTVFIEETYLSDGTAAKLECKALRLTDRSGVRFRGRLRGCLNVYEHRSNLGKRGRPDALS